MSLWWRGTRSGNPPGRRLRPGARRVPLLVVCALVSSAAGVAPATAGDTPPPAVARDIEILNRLLQQKNASPSAQQEPPEPAPQTAADPGPARIAALIAGLGDDAEKARKKARQDLVKIGAPAVPDLILALDDTEDRVRIQAAEALGSIRDRRAAEPLAGLLDTTSKDLWGAVYDALRKIGSPAVPALLDALEDPDQTVRRRAVRLMGRIHDPGAAEALIALLNKDRSTGVRVEIAETLGKIKDRAACDALLDALHDW